METKDKIWKELWQGKREFLDIMRLLVDFDAKTGRFRHYENPETHYMRRAISIADPDDLRILLCDRGECIYQVVAELSVPSAFLSATWLHEDGFPSDRQFLDGQRTHPVHKIPCLTDLYEKYAQELKLPGNESCLSGSTLELLFLEEAA